MLRIIKLVIGVAMMACLFLPLSTCSREPTSLEIAQRTATTTVHYERYVIEAGETHPAAYLLAIPFVLPLLLAIAAFFRLTSVAIEVVNILCALLVFIIILPDLWVAKLAVGGYLVCIAAPACLVASVVSIRQLREARAGQG